MMNGRLMTVLVFAFVVAAASSLAVYHFLASGMKQPEAVPQGRLVVANHDLVVGTLIREGDLRQIAWSGDLPAHSMNSIPEIIGRGVVTTTYKDEPIFEVRLAGKGAGAGLAATIPIGKRAVALRVNDVVGLAGFVQPGMHVDVLIAGNSPSSSSNESGVLARTVLQNIEVLSAGQKFEKNMEGKPEDAQVVNLLVSPDQAEVLSLAGSETKVQLVLRNPLDTQELPTQGTSISRLFSGSAAPSAPVRATRTRAPLTAVAKAIVTPPAPVPATREIETIEVFTGTKKTQQSIQASRGGVRDGS